ncbi:MAG: DUF1501 domain-containing protein [Planctomycetota bacterium]
MQPSPIDDFAASLTRRSFLGRSAVGAAAFASLGGPMALAAGAAGNDPARFGGLPGVPHFAPKAKRVIYLCMSGAPSQFETWDWKPKLRDLFGTELPESIRNGQRLTTMTSGQTSFPIAPSKFDFARHGECGTEVCETLPWTAKMVDDLCVLRAVHTDAINHDPAITFMQTGHQQPGRPSFGAWLSYGLGSLNRDLPSFVVMTPRWKGRQEAQALYQRLWGSGFLPSEYQGVSLRAAGDPVLYLKDPSGVERETRRTTLDALAELNQKRADELGDPEIRARIEQYEMAFRMQSAVPDLVNLDDEPQDVLDLYGPEAKLSGSFAASCLLARRLVERDVRFVQIYHRGWDQHGNLPMDLGNNCLDVDQPCYGLIQDLKRKGLLEDTLVIWSGEFGRTVYCQGGLSRDNYGRDHHPRCFSMWMAGAGVKTGQVYGETDDFSYNIVKDGVSVHDLNATILHLLGIDHERLTFRFAGRDFRLTDVHGELIRPVLA